MRTEPSAPADRVEFEAADGTRIVATVCGSGPTLILLHGWTLNRHSLRRQQEALVDRWCCIALDRRGFGESPAAPALDAELQDIDAVIEQAGGGAAHLLGISQGGRLALRYAVSRPDRLRSLIVQGAPIDGFEAKAQSEEAVPFERFRALARAGELDALRRLWLSHPMMSAGMDAPSRNELATIVAGYTGADLLAAAPPQSNSAINVYEALPTLSVPTLIITGALDTLERRTCAQELARRIPGARHEVIAGAGHMCSLSHADAFNTLLRAFCSEVDASSVSLPR